ncbi:MAG TPA: DUF1801 domain-containing protein [Chitinophagaceae bacterium]
MMSLKESDYFYLNQPELIKGCLLALRAIILQQDPEITAAWKYGMPFFCYKGKMFCYIWVHKKLKQPYLSIVEGNRLHHPGLIQEKRSRMKLILFEPHLDLPLKTIETILKKALNLYKNGIVKIKEK